jgi:GTP pyrophosphokinase
MVITSKAKTAIKAQLRENSKVELSKLGKHLISDALKYQKIDINDISKEKWKECLKELHCSNFHDLYIKVGLSEIFVAVVINKLLKDISKETINTITINKTKGMAINFAHCCYPIPGDQVTGVLTISKGMVMHRSNCANLAHIKEKNAQWMEIDWKSDDSELFEVNISCLVENRSGAFATIANILANLGVNIENIEQHNKPNAKKLISMVIVVANIIQLNNVLDKLKGGPHIVSATRN